MLGGRNHLSDEVWLVFQTHLLCKSAKDPIVQTSVGKPEKHQHEHEPVLVTWCVNGQQNRLSHSIFWLRLVHRSADFLEIAA